VEDGCCENDSLGFIILTVLEVLSAALDWAVWSKPTFPPRSMIMDAIRFAEMISNLSVPAHLLR
jgi:hypothetical protein